MLHARVIRPPAIGAKLISVDESSIKEFAGASVVRIRDFLAVVADDEWVAVRAARALRAQWTEWSGLPDQDKLVATLRADADYRRSTCHSRVARSAASDWRADALRQLFLANAEPRLDRSLLRSRRCARGHRHCMDCVTGHAWQS
jgi:hypothetical protein